MTIESLKGILHTERCSCVIYNGSVSCYNERGISDLYKLIKENPHSLSGALIADKVIGKAAAAILIVGNIGEVYTDVISHGAEDLFKAHGVEFSYSQRTHHIINRQKSGWCPMEWATREAKDAYEAFDIIDKIKSEL